MKRDYKQLGITVSRETRQNSLSQAKVDYFTFSLSDKTWSVMVTRKGASIHRTAIETLTIALKALATAHDIEGFSNPPKRVNQATTKWVVASELYEGVGSII